jgi:hypothetical protein
MGAGTRIFGVRFNGKGSKGLQGDIPGPKVLEKVPGYVARSQVLVSSHHGCEQKETQFASVTPAAGLAIG